MHRLVYSLILIKAFSVVSAAFSDTGISIRTILVYIISCERMSWHELAVTEVGWVWLSGYLLYAPSKGHEGQHTEAKLPICLMFCS